MFEIYQKEVYETLNEILEKIDNIGEINDMDEMDGDELF